MENWKTGNGELGNEKLRNWAKRMNKWENEICDHDDAVESFNENGHIYFQL